MIPLLNNILHSPFRDGFVMKFFVNLLSSRIIRALSSQAHFCLSVIFVGPTPIHAPVPRPIVYSIGIGTSDYPDEGVTVNTSGGPPQLNVSSFLDDLTAADTSSPVRRTSVSVLSPILQRTFSIVSPRRPRLTIESGVNAVVCCSDVSLSACVDTADKEVQAVIETADGSTCYEPQVETSLSASSPVVDDTELLTPDANQTATFASVHSEAIIPEDPAIGTGTLSDVPAGITIADPSSAALDSETVPLHLELELAVTSPMGPSLPDSDDEPIASHLPGYLNSFKTCEVSDQYLHSFIFLFHFC